MIAFTHAELDQLDRDAKGWRCSDGESVKIRATTLTELVALARGVIPGELLAEVRMPGFVPRGTQNSREHWGARQRRVKDERARVGLALAAGARKVRSQAARVGCVTITRLSAKMLDSDNCVGSLKGVRDSVAEWLCVDDGDRSITWRVEQRKVPRKEQGTIIRIEARDGRTV